MSQKHSANTTFSDYDEPDQPAMRPRSAASSKKRPTGIKGFCNSPRNHLVLFIFGLSIALFVLSYLNFYYTQESNRLLEELLASAVKYNAPESAAMKEGSRDLLPSI